MWVTISADQVLYVDRGRDVILCDRKLSNEIVVKLSPAALDALLRQVRQEFGRRTTPDA